MADSIPAESRLKVERPFRVVLMQRHGNGSYSALLGLSGFEASTVADQCKIDPQIKREEVRSLFQSYRIPPAESHVARLHEGLEIMARTNYARDSQGDISIGRILTHLQGLGAELPPLIEHERFCLENYDMLEPGRQFRQSHLDRFEALRVAVQNVRDALGKQPEKLRKADWHADAVWLAGVLAMVGASTGRTPNFKQAQGEDVILIEKALELGSVKMRVGAAKKPVSRDAIAKEFGRRAKEREPVPARAAIWQ